MHRIFAAAVIGILFSPLATPAVTLSLLPVGDVGNAIDPRPGAHLGAVNYPYWLDKYDVTNAQYVEFLNAKASVADPFGLYDTRMNDFDNGGITRSGTAPFSYLVKSNMTNKPVVYVSWYDALRFTNWLTNGQGNGDTETGSYLITGGGPNSGVVTVPSDSQRAAWASTSRHYLLPSANEWFKAAFYKGGGTNAGYWNYPLGSNNQPRGGRPNFAMADANVFDPASEGPILGPIKVTDVGAYFKNSPYGHADMAGNVFQWTDSLYHLDPQTIAFRGGAFTSGSDSYQGGGGGGLGGAWNDVGFRVMMVPEPSTLALAALGALGVLIAARHRKR